jgi:hypothetical protein
VERCLPDAAINEKRVHLENTHGKIAAKMMKGPFGENTEVKFNCGVKSRQ